MKILHAISRLARGAALAVWLAGLIAWASILLLFFAGLMVPNVTVRTVIEGWGWLAVVLAIVTIWVLSGGRHFWRLFNGTAVRIYAWSTVFAISGLVLFYTIERWRGHRAWQRVEMEMRGEPLGLRRLEPLPVTETQNFARLPVVAQWWSAGFGAGYRGVLERLLARVPNGGSGAWEMQRPVELEACLREYVPEAFEAGVSNAVSAAQFLEAWQKFAPEMEQVRLGTLRSHARFELPYDRGIFDRTLGRRAELFHALGQAFRLHAIAALRVGKPGVALSDIEHLLRISELVGQEPLLENQRLLLLQAALQPVWEGLGQHQWSEAQLAVLQASLERPDLLHEQRRAIRKEYLVVVDLCEKLFPARARVPAVEGGDDFASGALVTGMRLLYPSGWLLQNQVGLHQLSRELRELSVVPEAHRIYVERARQVQRLWVYRPPSLDPFFATFIMPRAGQIAEDTTHRYAFAQSSLDLAATACAIERYRLAHGQLPERLDRLVPSGASRARTDVVDGQPLRYRKVPGSRYVLYSVGWNQIDDGGRVSTNDPPREFWERVPIRDASDWVWFGAPEN